MTQFALLVGSDYLGTPNQLNGCGNDVRDIGDILQQGGFTTSILTDAQGLTYSNGQAVTVAGLPTKANIQTELNSMISNAKSGDTLIFYYSGHGTQIPAAIAGSEEDYIVPLDAVTNGFDQSLLISSNDLHKTLIRVPQGVKLLMVADSCFSGNITEFDVTTKGLKAKQSVVPFAHLKALFDAHPRSASSHGALTLIAGCKSTQESTDLGSNGALTAAIKEWINKNTLAQWLATCWNYTGKALSELKAALTSTIKSDGVTDQDPQISYDKDTSTLIPANTPVPAKPVTSTTSGISILNFLHSLLHKLDRSRRTTEPGSDPALFTQRTMVTSPAAKPTTSQGTQPANEEVSTPKTTSMTASR